MLKKYFRLEESGTTLRTEALAGVTTFATMAYIIFVQPVVLGAAGMDPSLPGSFFVVDAPECTPGSYTSLQVTNPENAVGTVTFTGASATGGGTTGSISRFAYDPITMATSSGQTKAAPSGLSAGGSSFSITWSHS